ncbi:MAG: magnesium/cobalt transporter CorA [Candidatus Omnitrophota bacterium]
MMEMIILGTGGCEVVTDVSVMKGRLEEADTAVWIDIEGPTQDDMRFLESLFHFHPLAIEDCMADIQRPKIDRYEDYLFIVLHAATLAPHKDKASSRELDVFLSRKFIVTVHVRPVRSITTARERYVKNPQFVSKGPAQLFYNITDAMVDNYTPILDKLDTDIEDMERLMFKSHTSESITKILSLTEIVLTLRRFIGPQREIINHIARGDYPNVFSRDLCVYFRDTNDILARISDTLDSYRDALTSLLDGYTSVASTRLNEIMKVLTVIATIMMPLTLITGIYGMNFRMMPELQWEYGYFVTIGSMILIAFGMLGYFKHKKWL